MAHAGAAITLFLLPYAAEAIIMLCYLMLVTLCALYERHHFIVYALLFHAYASLLLTLRCSCYRRHAYIFTLITRQNEYSDVIIPLPLLIAPLTRCRLLFFSHTLPLLLLRSDTCYHVATAAITMLPIFAMPRFSCC